MKRGIATILILLVIAGIFLIFNQGTLTGTGNVVKEGTYEDETDLLKKIKQDYIKAREEGKEAYFVFGLNDRIKIANYEEIIQGQYALNFGGKKQQLSIKETKYITKNAEFFGNEAKIKIGEKEYNLKINKGQNYYFVITQ